MLTYSIPFEAFDAPEALPAHARTLWEKALEATQLSYAPYSRFRVGAALLLEDGQILQGANQENAVYPSGLCAERVVLFQYGLRPQVPIQSIAVVACNESGVFVPVTPCGACRQVMVEYCERQTSPVEIFFQADEKQIYRLPNVLDLLPAHFGAAHLRA